MSDQPKNIFLTGLLLALLAAVLVIWQPAAAQEPEPTPSDNEVNRVAKQMYCPVCENIPLDVCPTQACQEWRELIREKLSQGWSDEQIKQYFATQYGDRVLAEPPRRGLNWVLYVGPVVIILAAAVFVWRLLVSMKQKSAGSAGAVAAEAARGTPAPGAVIYDEDDYIKQLEEELKKSE